MSEYVTVEPEPTDHPDVQLLYVNQALTSEDEEIYDGPDTGETGSPLAQALFFAVDDLAALTIKSDHLVVTRQPGTPWEMLIDEIRDALRDFFL